jgi:hypothetical protein
MIELASVDASIALIALSKSCWLFTVISSARAERGMPAITVQARAFRPLLTAWQAHSENRFCLVGPRLDLALMSPSDLARDVQSEPEIAVSIR